MPFVGTQVAVDDAPAVLLAEGAGEGNVGGAGDHEVTVRNAGPDEVYLGGAAVIATTGFSLANGSTVTFQALGSDDDLFGICAAAETATVHVLKRT